MLDAGCWMLDKGVVCLRYVRFQSVGFCATETTLTSTSVLPMAGTGWSETNATRWPCQGRSVSQSTTVHQTAAASAPNTGIVPTSCRTKAFIVAGTAVSTGRDIFQRSCSQSSEGAGEVWDVARLQTRVDVR